MIIPIALCGSGHALRTDTSIAAPAPSLYENRNLPFNINMLRNHVFVGARHAVPLPGNPVSPNFMNMKLRFHHSLCPRLGMAVCQRNAKYNRFLQ
jgi:hypothetical protein